MAEAGPRPGGYKLAVTGCLLLVWLANGVGSSMTGPALLDSAARLGVSLDQMAYIFSLSNVFMVLSAFINGVLGERLFAHSLLLVGALSCLAGALVAARTYTTAFPLYAAATFAINYAVMGADCLGNALVLRIWGTSANAPMHFLHTFFGLGMTVGPYAMRPFLAPELDQNNTNESCSNLGQGMFEDCSRIEVGFLIPGIVYFVAGAALIIFYLIGPNDLFEIHPPKTSLLKTLNPRSCADGKVTVTFTVVMLIMFFAFYFFNITVQNILTLYLFVYVTSGSPGLNLADGTLLVSMYNLAHLLGRLGAGLLSLSVSIQVLLGVEVVAAAVASVGVVLWAGDSRAALWGFLLPLGLTSAPLWPGGIAWTNSYITLTATAFLLLTVDIGVGGVFSHWLAGVVLGSGQFDRLMVVAMGGSLALVLVVAAMRLLAARGRRATRQGGSVNGGFSGSMGETQSKAGVEMPSTDTETTHM